MVTFFCGRSRRVNDAGKDLKIKCIHRAQPEILCGDESLPDSECSDRSPRQLSPIRIDYRLLGPKTRQRR